MRRAPLLMFVVCLMAAVGAQATSYTQDSNLSHFTTNVTFGTFTQQYPWGGAVDVPVPYTPTAASLNGGLRLVGDNLDTAIVVQFANPVSNIIVFPNIDHYGSAYDGYQYTVSGSNDGNTYTPLFDALTVNGSGEPFTLGTFTGTAPYRVNNVLTPGVGPGGTVGYEAFFSFSESYKYYEFGSSTMSINSGNEDQELSAVGITPEPGSLGTTPEPSSILLVGSGFVALAGTLRRKLLG
jgi:hypothetical protein